MKTTAPPCQLFWKSCNTVWISLALLLTASAGCVEIAKPDASQRDSLSAQTAETESESSTVVDPDTHTSPGTGDEIDSNSDTVIEIATDTHTNPDTSSEASVDTDPYDLISDDTDGYRLIGAPLLFSPTSTGFGLNVVLASGNPQSLSVRVRSAASDEYGALMTPKNVAADVARWELSGMEPGTQYVYQLLGSAYSEGGGASVLYEGTTVTARPTGDTFRFALITDSHIGANLKFTNQGTPEILKTAGTLVGAYQPDFIIHLGDMLDFHEFGFNSPPPNDAITRSAYLNYRALLGNTLGNTAHFSVIGNWEGENGDFSAEDRQRTIEVRKTYLPGPDATVYGEGGSANEDYYAFTWGDALFVVLNVQSYTPTAHLLSSTGGTSDDWTLGDAQMAWLVQTLQNATSKWRFLCIHHTVGGMGGTLADSNYGRGGGQAAWVGEQAAVHQLMIDNGVQIFFYGHDHVFTDMLVDGIHYTLPGSAGAPWMFTDAETGYEQYWMEAGWSEVTVSPTEVQVRFLNLNDTAIYEYTLTQ